MLLTTPECLESILVSASIDSRQTFADVRAVVVDEVHAFAGDDRGWHLLHVLERIAELAGGPLQRIGLSATVGNPERAARVAARLRHRPSPRRAWHHQRPHRRARCSSTTSVPSRGPRP